MHILFLCHYFPPEVNAPASRTYENAKRWVRAGHRVTVLTCHPSHPGGVVYPGFRNSVHAWDEKDGIRVLRVGTYLSANKGFVKRTANYVSFMFSAMAQCWRVKDVDVVVSTSPQFFCGMAGYFVSRLKRRPWVLEIRDLWPESIIAVGAISNRRVIKALEGIESFLYRKADHIVSLTRAFKRHIMDRGIADQKVSIVTNGADLERFAPADRMNDVRRELGLGESVFLASYIGTHGMAHGLNTILKAARRLENEPDIRFLLVGDGAERDKLLKAKEDMGLTNVIMLGQQPKERMPDFLAASDACLVLLIKSDLFKTVLPSKIFEAMAMKRPIVLGVEGESRELIEEAGCGICIEPENDQELAETVLRLARTPELCRKLGESGAEFVAQRFDRETLAREYLSILKRAAAIS
ncbi:MAG: glycosyltransferase WbuB [Deltaproteobacteria bacterium]|nr:glycosyltransferase WbuB [Deltaproteobacteria bacterium]